MPNASIIDTLAHIETPENVRLTFRLAGPGTRLGAYLLDLAIRVGMFWVLLWVATALMALVSLAGLSPGQVVGVVFVGLFVLEWGYCCLFEGLWNGRTPGKWVTGLRVIKEGGYPISFNDALLRNFLRAADVLPVFYGVGLLAMLGTRRMQRLGDLLAGTIVVREQRESLRGELPIVRSVPPIPRVQLTSAYRPSDRTLDLIERFFLRRAELPPTRAAEIATILARPLAERLGFQDEAREEVRQPSQFLLRVLRTFSHPPEEAADRNADASSELAQYATPVLLREVR